MTYKCIRCGELSNGYTNPRGLGLCTDHYNHVHMIHEWREYDPSLNPVDNTGAAIGTAGINATQAEIDTKQAIWSRLNQQQSTAKATRDPVSYRYDLLDPEFLYAMASIAAYGAEKYGDRNWQKSRLKGAGNPINHLHAHLANYQVGANYEHAAVGIDPKFQLAAVAFNAMIEFWYEGHPEVKP